MKLYWSKHHKEYMHMKIGDTVQLHPATDAWMQGDKFGVIVKIGKRLVHVHMVRSGKVRKVSQRNLFEVESQI